MEKLTLRDLQRLGACDDAKVAFEKQFPNGAALHEVVAALADHPQGVEWWGELASQMSALAPALVEFERVTDTAWTEYVRIIGTALAECKRVRDTARAEHDTICRNALRGIAAGMAAEVATQAEPAAS